MLASSQEMRAEREQNQYVSNKSVWINFPDTLEAAFIKESLEALDGYWETVEVKNNRLVCESAGVV